MNQKALKKLRKAAKERFGPGWKDAYKWVKNETKKRKKQGQNPPAMGKG